MGLVEQLKELLHPYYIVNILLSASFVTCKMVRPVCELVFSGDCEFGGRQSEILFLMAIVIMLKARKTGALGLVSYLANAFAYCKIGNSVLWFLAYKPYGFIYLMFYLLQGLLLPEPAYDGPENIVYFRDETLFKEETSKKGTTWLIEFYTTWNPTCINFAPVFAELSTKYSLSNLKFGKVDVGRLPILAEKYRISDSALSRQLPTVILFKDGEPVSRRPGFDSNGKLIKFLFTSENIVNAFGLNDLYSDRKSNLKQKEKPSRLKSD